MFLSGMQRRFKQIGRKPTNQISCLFGKISTEIEIMFKVSTGLSNRYLKVCEFFIDLGDNIVPPWIESHFVGEICTDESLTQGWVKLFKSAQIHVWNANCLICCSNWDELKILCVSKVLPNIFVTPCAKLSETMVEILLAAGLRTPVVWDRKNKSTWTCFFLNPYMYPLPNVLRGSGYLVTGYM